MASNNSTRNTTVPKGAAAADSSRVGEIETYLSASYSVCGTPGDFLCDADELLDEALAVLSVLRLQLHRDRDATSALQECVPAIDAVFRPLRIVKGLICAAHPINAAVAP